MPPAHHRAQEIPISLQTPSRGRALRTGPETKDGSLCQGQGAGQSASTLHSQLQEPSLGPTGAARRGASVLHPQHPPKPFSLTTEVPATTQLPSQAPTPPQVPVPGPSCNHQLGAECGTQGQGRGRWPRQSREHRQGGKAASGWCTAGEAAKHGQGHGWSAAGQRAAAGRLSSTLKSLTKAGLNDQKFHLIGQIKK